MSKVSNNISPIKKDTKTTEKSSFLKWQPIVRKVIGYVVFAGFSMLSNNQSPQVVINVSIKVIKELPAEIEEVIHQVPNLPLGDPRLLQEVGDLRR